MGEPNNSAPRGRKRKGSSKSSTKSNKRKASAAEVLVKQEPIIASPVSLPRNLDLSTAVIPQNVLPNNPQQAQTNDGPKSLTNIPNEIFVQICANLPPSDLLSLTLVCQKLKGLLCSPSSQETQAIWRTSRARFLRFLQAPPPPGMDEKSYIVLKQLEKGCQFCHKMGFIKVYWEFRVRCCESCLDQRTMSRDKLFIENCIPNEVFRTLPHIFRIASSFYWIKDVSRACEIFNSLNEEDKQDWVEQGEEFANMIMQETIKHKQEEQNEQMAKFEECLTVQSSNPNYTYPSTQQRIIIRQPQLTTAPINFASVTPMANVPSTPMIPSIGTMGLTNSQVQLQHLQQFNQPQLLIPQMQNVIPFNRSPFMITSPTQQFYSQSPFMSRATHQQMISQQQMVPSHMMTGIPQMLTPPQMLTSQMVSQHCFGVPQFYQF